MQLLILIKPIRYCKRVSNGAVTKYISFVITGSGTLKKTEEARFTSFYRYLCFNHKSLTIAKIRFMKKLVVCVCAYLIMAMPFATKTVSADETNSYNDETRVENYISGIYKLIDFSHSEVLPYDVFDKACRGYLNLRNAGKLNTESQVITICDLELPSVNDRMWIIDLDQKKVLFNTYVAHGQGSGEDGALTFSNNSSTHKSSLGFYVTGDTYEGEHGTSLHLNGMDQGFNDAAYDRSIVVHGADYVCKQYISKKNRIGRSWGCPAVPSKLSLPIINTIKDGTCLFIYYPEPKYLQASCWLNKKVAYIPGYSMVDNTPPQATAQPKVKEIQYITNGHTDSVKTVAVSN